MSDTTLTTRAQQRAAVAARLVGSDDVKAVKKRYNSLVHSLPVMVRTNGLLQTLAFLLAKQGGSDTQEASAKTAEGLVVAHLKRHLRDAGYLKGTDDLVEVFGAADYPAYQRMQEEAVTCLAWHKRFSTGRFGPPEQDEGGGDR